MTIERESSPPRHAVVDVEKKKKRNPATIGNGKRYWLVNYARIREEIPGRA
jgi:hypothetical protein